MNLDTLHQGTFQVWQPDAVDIIKGGEKEDRWRIGGFASTGAQDRQGEEVLQRGLDFTEFVQHGWYNDNHQQHSASPIGVPELAEYRKSKGWWTEGYLLKSVKRAVEVFHLAKSLATEASHRKLGFSIEGKILERLGNKIVKAIIRNVAITASPVNTECAWGILAKSWANDLECKALSVGHARVASEGGRVLVPEDLEKDELKYVYYCPHCKKAFSSEPGLDGHLQKAHFSGPVTMEHYPPGSTIRRVAKAFTREDAVEHLRRIRPEYSEDVCARLVDYAFTGVEL